MITALIFILGLVVGSFLNVCIYRLPLQKSIVKPRSYCPNCNKTIPWYDNIPLLSYIILKGRCRFCKNKIPFQYFLVELLTGLIFVVLFKRYGLGFDLFFYLIFVCGLIIASFVDINHRIIPDEVSLGGVVMGFVFNVIKSIFLHSFIPVKGSFLGILVGGGIIYFSGAAFDFVYFKLLKKPPIDGETESMGGGDIKFLAMIGAFLGWDSALLTFFIAPFIGLFFGLINLYLTKRHTIPYGPFLALAAFSIFFWKQPILNFLFFRLWK